MRSLEFFLLYYYFVVFWRASLRQMAILKDYVVLFFVIFNYRIIVPMQFFFI